jgi:hypothetical protein
MPAEQLIFVGFEVTEQLAAGLEECHERDRVYLDDPIHLETAVVDGCRFIGKRISSGAAYDRLEDTARSVVSLIARVSGEIDLDPSRAVLLALEERQQSQLGAPILDRD